MKKVLFGIMALSVAAFAATAINPGTGSPETASVPVKVMAEIIAAPNGLVITDEAGTVLDELLLDHGKIVKDAAIDDSVAYKVFKVQKYENGQNIAFTTNGTIEIELDKGVGNNRGTATLSKDGLSDATSKLTSKLSLSGGEALGTPLEYTHKVVENEKVHTGRVISRITKEQLKNGAIKTGIYHNARANTLTVIYTPTKGEVGK